MEAALNAPAIPQWAETLARAAVRRHGKCERSMRAAIAEFQRERVNAKTDETKAGFDYVLGWLREHTENTWPDLPLEAEDRERYP